MEDLKKISLSLPDCPGVYLFKNSFDTVLYVGKALSLKKRVSSYFNITAQRNLKIKTLISNVDHLDTIQTSDENQALLLECNLIKKYRPRYNVVLRDDKSYPYLKLTVQEAFPRIFITRRPAQDGARYYGPYPNLKLREIIKMIYCYFNIRDCEIEIDGKAQRACLSYQIKQCPAPCIGVIKSDKYKKLVKNVEWFLEGKHERLIDHVKKEMLAASERMDYEEAAKNRDLISSLEQLQSGYAVISDERKDMDVIAFAEGLGKVLASVLRIRQGKVLDHVRFTLENELEEPLNKVFPEFIKQFYVPGVFIPEEIITSDELEPELWIEKWLSDNKNCKVIISAANNGLKRELMEMAEKNVLSALKDDLQQTEVLKDIKGLLGLKTIPRGIACFDISTLQGTFTVGSAVFFKDGVPEKDRYRKFKIREISGQDDYRAHQEMMRRYLHLIEREGNSSPDLFLIDGGKGQLNAVEMIIKEVLKENYGLASLAKREEEVFIPRKSKPVDFRGHLKARYLLQRVRDESHRFAVGYHRIIRDRKAITSILKEVKGLGPSRLRSLFNHFESFKEIQAAEIQELASVQGFSRELATVLHQVLHKEKVKP